MPSVQFIEGGAFDLPAFDLPALVPEQVDYVLLANTFHGVPEQTALSALVYSALTDGGLFGIINWYPKPREQTPVLGKPRGPSTETRMSPEAVREVVEPAGFALERVVDRRPITMGQYFGRTRKALSLDEESAA